MNILFVNGWSDDNKGDSAIVQGMIKLIREIKPSTNFYINSALDIRDTKDKEYHYRYMQDLGVSEIGSSPLIRKGGKLIKYFSVFVAVTITILPVLSKLKTIRYLLRRIFNENYLTALDNYRKADVVISKGGHIFVSLGGMSGAITFLINAMPLVLGMGFKKPVYIYAQSIGPIKGTLSVFLAKKVLSKVKKVYLREQVSYECISNEIGIKGADICWDTAFAIKGESNNPLNIDRKYAVFTVRQWNFPEDESSSGKLVDKYVDTIVSMMEQVNNEHGYIPVLVPQVIGPTPLENDLIMIEKFEEKISGRVEYLAFKNDYSIQELADIYASAELVVGTRFHSVILSLASETPALAISYHGYKTKGIMAMMGLGEYVLDIYNLPETSETLTNFINEIPQIKDDLKKKMKQVREESLGKVDELIKSIGH